MQLTSKTLRNIFFATAASFVVMACSQESDTGASSTSSGSAASYNLTLDMTEFMAHVVEPIADTLWKSAGWILDENEGYYELYPTDDAGWENVHNHGAMIVEAGNLMMLPGRAVDGAWMTYSEAISTVGGRIMTAADAQNKEDLFQAGAQLYSVCSACHQAYNPEIMSRFQP
ncbi:MAG: hypothetical protein Q7W55_07675 [Pseudohongiella sp.]|nr:hypothetical protein [Pseudohongiella sp.]MDP2125862.1 hypothetical protein [Pseudohongiella sp.]